MTDMPIANERSETSVLVPEANHAQKRFAEETHGRWVGPFNIHHFLGLLPSSGQYRSPPCDIFHRIPKDQCEADMYSSLIDILNSLNLKNLRFVGTRHLADDNAPHHKQWSPGISVYPIDFKFEDQAILSPLRNIICPSPTRFTEILLFFEVGRGKHDPFCDNPEGPNAGFESEHVDAQGQIAAILNEVFSYSPRTHAFSVYMDGHIARLLRADRSGIIISEAIDYRRDSFLLVEFLHRFDQATPAQRGLDMMFDRHFEEFKVPNTHHAPNYTTVRLGELLPHTESLVGQGNRVVRVYDPISMRPFYLKDGWRARLPEMTSEFDMVGHLNKHGVPHIPKILKGGNTGWVYDCTLADQFSQCWWRVGPKTQLIPRAHHRFIEESAAKPLKQFANAKELTQVLADVLEALRKAWVRCRYLHCDVNSANIMITPQGRGVLMNWDSAKEIPLVGDEHDWTTTRADERSATSVYVSAALLRCPGKCRSPLDDLQSVYWVALENALNCLDHKPTDLFRVAECLSDHQSLPQSMGDSKGSFLSDATPIEFVGNPAFSSLMNDFRGMMDRADNWETSLSRGEGPTLQSSSGVPDHDNVLERFRKALRCPAEDWLPERNESDEHPLQVAIEQVLLRGVGDFASSRFEIKYHKRLQSSGSSSEAGESWLPKRSEIQTL